MQPQSIGESSISPQAQSQVAPEVTQPQGQSQLFQKAIEANKIKPLFDAVLKKIADKVGGESSSRVKQIETMAAKVAQKRLQGRSYGISNINDALGGRIVVKTITQAREAKQEINQLGKQGVFQINNAEPVKTGDYKAYHFDVTLPNGLPSEIQIHDRHSAANAVINHDLRSVYGEKPESEAVTKLRDTQTKMIKSMPGDKAFSLSKVIQQMRSQNNNKPLDPRVTASILAKAK